MPPLHRRWANFSPLVFVLFCITIERSNFGVLMERKKLPPQERLTRLKIKARKELSVAGTVQFRLDEETMQLLMKAADKKKLPLGTLVRMWTVERLAAEGFSS